MVMVMEVDFEQSREKRKKEMVRDGAYQRQRKEGKREEEYTHTYRCIRLR